MMLRLSRLVPGLLILSLLCCCASLSSYTETTARARLSLAQGRFDDALEAFPETAARGRNEVLVRLERAVILQAMGRFEESAREFQLGVERIREFERRAVVSAGRTVSQAGSLLVNEQVRPYEGEDFEKILVHAVNAVNYLMTGDLEGARVEIRNAYTRQNELHDRHARELQKAREERGAAGWKESFEKADREGYGELEAKAAGVYSVYQNAFAYAVSALVYELGGEYDEAYIDLKKAVLAAPDSRSIRRDLIRLSRKLGFYEDERMWVDRWGELEDGYGEGTDVFVIFQHGSAPVKEPVSFPIVLSEGGIVFASMPVYRFVPSGTSSGLVLWDGGNARTSVLSDTDAIAARSLLDETPVLFAKQVARSAFKGWLTGRLTREHDAVGAVAGTLMSALTEQADLRTWSSLPKEIHTARAFVPESVRRIAIRSVPSGRCGEVEIPEAARHLIVVCRDTRAGLSLRAKAF